MVNKYSIGLLIVLILGGLGAAAFFMQGRVTTTSLERELAAYIVPPVSLGGVPYTVYNGRVYNAGTPVSGGTESAVLKVARYAVLARLDPIGSIEGTDPDKLASSTAALQANVATFVGDFPQDEQMSIRQSLYPIDFLKNLSTLEKLRQQLVSQPTPQLVNQYHAQLLTTLKAYTKDLDGYQAALQTFNKSQTLCFEFLAGTTCVPAMLASVDELAAAATAQEDVEQKRFQCYKGKESACVPLADALRAATQAAHVQVDASRQTTPFTPAIDHIGALERSFAPQLEPADFPKGIMLAFSRCFTGTPYYNLLWLPSKGGVAIQPDFENDIYFYSTHSTSSSFLSAVAKQGLQYLHQRETNSYSCPLIGYDWSSAVTTYALWHGASAIEFSAQGDLAAAAAARQAFASSTLPSDKSLLQYSGALASVLEQKGEIGLAQEVGTSTVLAIEKVLLTSRGQTADLDGLINAAVRTDGSIHAILHLSGYVPSQVLFVVHGTPSFFYLPFNRTLIPKLIPDLFITYMQPNPSNKFHLLDYRKTMPKLSDDQIRAIYRQTEALYGQQATSK